MANDPSCREHLEYFVDRILPGLLRRFRCWSGFDARRHADVVHDICQELWLDLVTHDAELEGKSQGELHARWFRIADRHHYWLRVQGRRRNVGMAALSDLCDPGDQQAGGSIDVAPQTAQAAVAVDRVAAKLRNGRFNTTGTAKRLGLPRGELRAMCARIAGDLGFDADFLAFWRARLAEALVGLAADLLRDRQLVKVHDEAHRVRPDPSGRLGRIARIKRVVSVRPLPWDLRTILARFTAAGIQDRVHPAMALQAAGQLLPDNVVVLLWAFETAVVDGQLDQAVRALRRARQSGADPIRLILARARLFEAAGREDAARRLLERSARRHRGDRRIELTLGALRGERPAATA